MNGILDFLKTLGPTRIAAMGVVTAALVGFFAFIMVRVAEPTLSPLYTDISFEDSIQISKLLEAQNVVHEIRNDGAVILAPKDQILKLRMQMAESGLPNGGNVGYEIFDKSETLGTTSFVQNINHLRALEGELSRSIRTIRNVRQARVHLVLPKRQLFKREQKTPTASIAVKLQGSLNDSQIQAIQHLVGSAVEGLEPQNVTIIDGKGRLLASGRGNEDNFLSARIDERRMQMEGRLRDQVQDIVSSIVGQGRSRIEVTAEMDFNKVTETSDTFDPDGQVVRSTQTRSEEANSQEKESNDGVTVGNELPGAADNQGDAAGRQEATNVTEELINYEISRKTTTEVVQGGRISRLSVAVLVDGAYEKNANDELVYQPRSADELEQIATLVRSAVGFDQGRGDKIEVINLQFAEGPESVFDDAGEELFAFTKDDYIRIAELAILLIMTLMVLLLVVRPLMKRMFEKPEKEEEAEAILGADGVVMIKTENGELIPAPENNDPKHPTMQAIEHAQMQGALQSDTLIKVGEMVKDNPEEAAKIIRLWLQDAA
ncbi:flagellar basal-body MS-ring/collar protein FliF [Cohaesibacter celericrescens]|uniref:Flagellar M-ring protein n=1 Tax=Cohaesibacter celericrescens TaxID=2067669 RepID=A0A2N5XM92_9HYPH|nr:flagellar basal-body MS-ring/collar protein FliF [Cohaesibacter celericrescens]PLW75612.1 flagellar M-ring protein FliF [Cohaesibacter celericrescens]